MPTSNNDELAKAKMYAIVDGERVDVMELQGKAALSEADEKELYDDYIRADEKAPYDYCIENVWCRQFTVEMPTEFVVDEENQ